MLAAQRAGFDQVRAGEFALMATEAARNVLLHGGGGEAVIWTHTGEHGALGRILALDRGPGIKDVARALDDGYSTSGTLGMGFGAMRRLATSFEVFTARNGTIVFLELAPDAKKDSFEFAGVAVPFPGERVCGDAWAYHRDRDRIVVLLVDGLGHGPDAADAAAEAVKTFAKHAAHGPGAILARVHDALKKTRGAAGAVAEIERGTKTLTYAGVGNTSGVMLSAQVSRNLVSHNGTLGMLAPKIQEFRVEWPDDALLILHSDGVNSKWDLSSYSGLLARHPAVIGGALLRDFRRQRDDASVVVVRNSKERR